MLCCRVALGRDLQRTESFGHCTLNQCLSDRAAHVEGGPAVGRISRYSNTGHNVPCLAVLCARGVEEFSEERRVAESGTVCTAHGLFLIDYKRERGRCNLAGFSESKAKTTSARPVFIRDIGVCGFRNMQVTGCALSGQFNRNLASILIIPPTTEAGSPTHFEGSICFELKSSYSRSCEVAL